MPLELNQYDSLDMHLHIQLQGLAVKETLSKNRERVKKLASELNFSNIVINGAGDKFLVPYIASFLWKALGNKPIEVIHSRTLADNLPRYVNRDSLVIFVSQSGKTKDTMDAARAVSKTGAKMLVVTNLREKEENSLWFVEDFGGVVLNTFTPIYPERALPSTLTFHSSLALLYYLFAELAGADIYEELRKLAEKVDRMSRDREIEHWGLERAQELVRLSAESKYVLGDGPRYGLARKLAMIMLMEGAKENASPLETEEFPHSLIETLEEYNPKKLGMIMFLPPKEHAMREEAEKIVGVWKRHTNVLAIEPPKASDDPLLNNLLSPQLQIIPAEWVAYYLALLKGIDPGTGHIVKKVRSGSFW